MKHVLLSLFLVFPSLVFAHAPEVRVVGFLQVFCTRFWALII